MSTHPDHGEQMAFNPGGTLYVNDINGVEKVGAGGMLTTVASDDGQYGFRWAWA